MADPVAPPGGPTFTPPPAGSSLTPSALRARSLRRTLSVLIGIVLVVGGLFMWLQSRQNQVASNKQARTQKHVLLKPNEEGQDWRLKEGARVEELVTTLNHLRRDTTELQSQMLLLQKHPRARQDRDGVTDTPEDGSKGSQRRRSASPPLPPLSQILPPGPTRTLPEADRRSSPSGRTSGRSAPEEGTLPRPPLSSPQADQASHPSIPSSENDITSGIDRIIVANTKEPKTPPPPRDHQPPPTHPPTQAQPKMRVILPSPSADHKDRKPVQSIGWLPSGSFVKATLLTGVDAGTGTGSNLPYPVLMRLTDPSILPNRYKMDLAECFVVGAAWGDLASERVYIRSETLSCIRRPSFDIITIDGDLKAQVMGEDGKLGLRGRVVSKEGTMIARSLWAGFLSGLSSAFKPRITYSPLLLGNDNSNNGQNQFGLPPIDDTLTAAGISGVGKSMDLVANYYLKQAQNLFPVIEIDSGRTVDLVVLKGMPLKFNVQHTAGSTAQQEVID